jgi:purine-nucleoside phosphorylase
MHEYVKLRDIVLAMSASTDSAVNRCALQWNGLRADASFTLLKAAGIRDSARTASVRGPVLSSTCSTPRSRSVETLGKFGVVAVEMETAELYTLAAKYGCEALSVLTISIINHRRKDEFRRNASFLPCHDGSRA